MLGFLGTVMGMVSAFFEVEQRGTMDIQVLASGIYTAMITTVLGLIVGILAYLAYNYFNKTLHNNLVMLKLIMKSKSPLRSF